MKKVFFLVMTLVLISMAGCFESSDSKESKKNIMVLSADKQSIKADGQDSAKIIATIKDGDGKTISNLKIDFYVNEILSVSTTSGEFTFQTSKDGEFTITAKNGADLAQSLKITAIKVVNQKTAAPILPKSALFTTVTSITIPVLAGTTVRYTKDGTIPNRTTGIEIKTDEKIVISSKTTISAIAYKDGYDDSNVVTAVYEIKADTKKIAAPILPKSGLFTTITSITIPVVSGTTVRYTKDGTIPSKTTGIEIKADTKITIDKKTTISAIAYKDGYEESEVVVAVYNINFFKRNEKFVMYDNTVNVNKINNYTVEYRIDYPNNSKTVFLLYGDTGNKGILIEDKNLEKTLIESIGTKQYMYHVNAAGENSEMVLVFEKDTKVFSAYTYNWQDSTKYLLITLKMNNGKAEVIDSPADVEETINRLKQFFEENMENKDIFDNTIDAMVMTADYSLVETSTEADPKIKEEKFLTINTKSFENSIKRKPKIKDWGDTKKEAEESKGWWDSLCDFWDSLTNWFGSPPKPNKSGNRSNSYGDPHISTFDDEHYEFQQRGEFVFLESTKTPNALTVQVREEAWSDSDSVSYNTALAMNVAGDKVEVHTNLNKYSSNLYIGGKPITIGKDTLWKLQNGGKILLNEDGNSFYTIIWPEPYNVRVDITMQEEYLDFSIDIPDSLKAGIRGLGGNFDGNIENEFTTREGKILPADYEYIYNEFSKSWRITQGESLFTYVTGENTATYTDLNFPRKIITVEDIPEAEYKQIEKMCIDSGITDPTLIRDTILDYYITKDKSVFENREEINEDFEDNPPAVDITAKTTDMTVVITGNVDRATALTIEWGDGNKDKFTSDISKLNKRHTYALEGDYIIKIVAENGKGESDLLEQSAIARKAVIAAGEGITGNYFNGVKFEKLIYSRTDKYIDFDWNINSPDNIIYKGVDPESFSVRWTGSFTASKTGTYLFHTYTDDGSRLWINGELIIDNWTMHSETMDIGEIDLTAGKKYTFRMETYEGGGYAVSKLKWIIPEGTNEYVFPLTTDKMAGELVGFWTFDESDARDTSGNNNHGTTNGGVTFVNGVKGKAASFDGETGYIKIPSSIGLNSIEKNNEITISACINLDNFNNNYAAVFDKYNSDNDGGMCFEFNPTKELGYTTTTWINGFGYEYNIKGWKYMTLTYSNGVVKTYINGVKVKESQMEMTFEDTGNGDVYIGFSPSGDDDYGKFIIDELRIYNKVLTDKEISDLFKAFPVKS